MPAINFINLYFSNPTKCSYRMPITCIHCLQLAFVILIITSQLISINSSSIQQTSAPSSLNPLHHLAAQVDVRKNLPPAQQQHDSAQARNSHNPRELTRFQSNSFVDAPNPLRFGEHSASSYQSSQLNSQKKRPSSGVAPIDNTSPSFYNSNISINQNFDSYTISEGSGNGPSSSVRNKTKFDDSEEGDDDDEDDYDYRDSLDIGSGSGHNNNNNNNNNFLKPVVANLSNIPAKKPSQESEIYLPFRPPATTTISNNNLTTSTLASIITTRTTTLKPSTTILPISEAPYNQLNLTRQQVSINRNENFNLSSPTRVYTQIPMENITSQRNTVVTTLPTIIIAQDNSQVNSSYTLYDKQRQVTMTPVMFNHSTYRFETTIMPDSIIGSLPSSINITRGKVDNSNHLKPNASKNGDIDYDYEDDENDDEDSDDVSNFEDNEFSELETNNKSSNNNNKTLTTILPKPQHTTPKPAITSPATTSVSSSTTPKTVNVQPKPYIPPTQPSKLYDLVNNGVNQNFAQSKEPPILENRFSTTIAPSVIYSSQSSTSSIKPNPDRDEEEEEEENEEDIENEEDEEEEEEEEELDEEEPSEKESPMMPSSREPNNLHQLNINSSKPNWPPPSPSTPMQPRPTVYDSLDENYNIPSKGYSEFLTTTTSPSSSSINYKPSEHLTTTTYRPLTTTNSIIIPIVTQMPKSTVTVSTTPTTTTTFSNYQSTAVPIYVSPTTTSRMSPPPPPPLPPYFQYTTPRARTTITSNNIMTYDRSLEQDDGTGLTRQIYDKAVEVYQATNKAIEAAVEAVSAIELNKKTFEPLLADSLLFMLGLGAFVITLVLTMMLVVYIIDKKIQPSSPSIRDDISIY